MAKYKNEVSAETINQAEKIAKATQRAGQTKQQTKLIAQGIQKGIEQYKKSHKSKARELNKKIKTLSIKKSEKSLETKETQSDTPQNKGYFWIILPWVLLSLSWIYFFSL